MRSAVIAVFLLFLQGAPAPPAGSIEGYVVRTGTSTPIARARVDLRREGAAPAISGVMTDDGGRFSIRGIPPGRYRLFATRDGYVPGQFGERGRGGPGALITIEPQKEIKDIVVGLTPKGAISGRVYDRFGDPVVNGNVQALRHTYLDGRRVLIPVDNARTNDLGEYRLFWLPPDQYVISAAPAKEILGTYLPVYYPGTTDAAGATQINLAAGINLTGVDLQVAETRAVRVRGRVTNGITGQPAIGAGITLVPRRGTVATGSTERASISAAGVFELQHIAPGSYDLVASAPGTGGRLATSLPISVGREDVDNLSLVIQPQLSINGKVTFENTQTGAVMPSVGAVRVELRRESYTPELLVVLPTVAADGTFTLNGVTPGDYRIKVGVTGVSGYTKSARFGGIDSLNPPFRIDAPAPLEIVIDLNAGSIDGIAMDDMQKPYDDATVILVPDPPRRQRTDLYYVVGSDASGQFHLKSLAPGDYKLFAWTTVPADAWLDPDFLRPFEDRGKAVRITEGSNQNVEVKLIP